MQVETAAPDRFLDMVETLESIAKHRRSRPGAESDARYYELMGAYYRRVIEAKETGKQVVAFTSQVPTEAITAMDMVPMFLEGAAVTMAITRKSFEETFSQSKAMGYAPEICSVHRCIIAAFGNDWGPRPAAVVSSNQPCDNNMKSVTPMVKAMKIPNYFLDGPYYLGERDVEYFAHELEDMVAFLEETSGRRLDLDSLVETLHRSQQMVELHKEIYRLRSSVPSPVVNRKPQQIASIMRSFMGTQEGLDYMTVVRDEIKAIVETGKGNGCPENFRLISIFAPPAYNWKILDWMERERGAMIVSEPHSSHWGDVNWDFNQPMLTMASKALANPTGRQLAGPLETGLKQAVLKDAETQRADGAIYWAGTGCRQGCAAIRTLKDSLRDSSELPTAVVDMDNCDPTFVSDDELKDKLEGFFDLLESHK
ncbi:MAG: 2-hydroxyacyl-CoA dehydratase family protein [Dehalococcoidia bacterium]|nr:2-hydroxyacyl-CoA dehydratase family protein [Dehalococcoidia bacterium]